MATATQPCDLTISEAAGLLDRGELSPVELVESCLARIDAHDEAVKAWALVDREGALRVARERASELSAGERKGPLHGIPVGIKDIIFTAGLRTEAGSVIWKGFVPDYDATSVARLKAAGAIILGKTHTTEFAFQDPAPTRNPWDLEHTPGGSSSGSGAAVAAGMCLAALGTQTGGSTLRPAAYNGIVGLKATHGRISARGVIPISWAMDHVGVLARTVEDAALVLTATAGHDPNDSYSLVDSPPDYASVRASSAPPRLGIVRDYFFERVDDEMRAHTDGVIEAFRKAGASVDELRLPPGLATAPDIWPKLAWTDCATYHKDDFARRPDDYSPHIREIIEKGLKTTGTEYTEAYLARLRLRDEMAPAIGEFDAVLTPGATGPAPRGLSSTGNAAMNMPWTLIGFPAISLPSGLSERGLPLAVQLIADPFAEERLLGVAAWCEQALGIQLRPPLEPAA